MDNKTDAYKLLHIPENASREEIDGAYAALMERFSEDNYMGSPLWDMAAEKRRQIRAAYELLSPGYAEPVPEEAVPEGPVIQGSLPEESVSVRVRNLLNAGKPEEADALLGQQPDLETDPELIYLRGMAAWKRGWLDEAAKAVKQAAALEPQNAEYKAALDKILSEPPSLTKLKASKKTAGKRICGTCGDAMGLCLCEVLCEGICEGVSGGC